MDKKYKLSDLKIGMEVRESQLRDIMDTFVILDNSTVIQTEHGSDISGTIWFIGASLDDTYAKMDREGRHLGIIYNRSMDREGLVDYS